MEQGREVESETFRLCLLSAVQTVCVCVFCKGCVWCCEAVYTSGTYSHATRQQTWRVCPFYLRLFCLNNITRGHRGGVDVPPLPQTPQESCYQNTQLSPPGGCSWTFGAIIGRGN